MLAALAGLSDRARLWLLLAVAAVSVAVYVPLTVSMSLHEFFPGPGVTLDFQYMLGDDWVANTWWLYGSFAVLLVLWGAALWLVAPLRVSRWSVGVVTLGGVAMAAALVPMYPPFAVDFFHYLGEGRLFWVEGQNPMVRGPGEFFPIGMSYGNEPSAYGPLWYWTLGPPVLAGGDDFPRSLLLLKGWMCLWVAGAAWLGAAIARRLDRGLAARSAPDGGVASGAGGRELLVAVAIAWNPYVLWRVAGNGHNDIAMAALAMLAVWLALPSADGRAGLWRWAPAALMASVLIKYVSLLLGPVFAVWWWSEWRRAEGEARRRLVRELALGGVIAAALAVAAFWPMWEGFSVFDQVREQSDRIISSTPGLLATFLHDAFDLSSEDADTLALRMGAAATVVVALALLWRQWRGGVDGAWPVAARAVGTGALVLLGYAILGVGWFRPWYFLWVVPLAATLPGRWWLTLVVATSVAGLLPDVAEKYAVFVPWLRFLTRTHSALPAVMLQFGPPTLAWLVALVATRAATFGVGRREGTQASEAAS
jgi:hypothetical protein